MLPFNLLFFVYCFLFVRILAHKNTKNGIDNRYYFEKK